ncbi:MAG: TolC family protein [Vicinamibacterales bacterium]
MRRLIDAAVVGLIAVCSVAPADARAQETVRGSSALNPFLGGVAREAAGAPLSLSLAEALRRGLDRNLGVLLQEQRVRTADGARWRQLSGLLPDVSGLVHETREKVNLAALGFAGFPGIPNIIGPFNVFDARVSLSQPLVDVGAVFEAREGAAALRAERHAYQDARNLVTLVVTNLYLRTVAEASRVDAARAQAETAESLYQLAVDRNSAGVVPRIEVLRADVERKAAVQRRIVVENELARARLALARAIGLPTGQAFSLADQMPYAPAAVVDQASAVEAAYGQRADFLQARARVEAARASLAAARAERLPRLTLDANYGWIGAVPSSAVSTFTVTANVHVPIFAAGRTHARSLESDAELRRRELELEDLRGRIVYDIQTALGDAAAAAEQVDVAQGAVDLADQVLTQAEDRFRAGVAANIEVIQAQEAAVAAREAFISSLYAHNLAKAGLARAIGIGEQDFSRFMEGRAP